MTDRQIDNKIKKIRELEAQAALIKDQIEDLRDTLKDELDARKVDSISTKIHNIFYSCYERSGVDSKKLKDAGLYDQYSKKSLVTQFRITDINPV